VDLKKYLGAADDVNKPSAAPKPAESVDEVAENIVTMLEKSHCFFADLLDKFPSTDYKSVASAVARLYEDGKISQDKDGKFGLKINESHP
jgi:hypothetical protein